jgi:hypothetical protein
MLQPIFFIRRRQDHRRCLMAQVIAHPHGAEPLDLTGLPDPEQQ